MLVLPSPLTTAVLACIGESVTAESAPTSGGSTESAQSGTDAFVDLDIGELTLLLGGEEAGDDDA